MVDHVWMFFFFAMFAMFDDHRGRICLPCVMTTGDVVYMYYVYINIYICIYTYILFIDICMYVTICNADNECLYYQKIRMNSYKFLFSMNMP